MGVMFCTVRYSWELFHGQAFRKRHRFDWESLCMCFQSAAFVPSDSRVLVVSFLIGARETRIPGFGYGQVETMGSCRCLSLSGLAESWSLERVSVSMGSSHAQETSSKQGLR